MRTARGNGGRRIRAAGAALVFASLALAAAGRCGGEASPAAACPGPWPPSPVVAQAVERGLRWLAAAQLPDGSWGGEPGGQSPPAALTALAGLALLAAGRSPAAGPDAPALRRAVRFLLDCAERRRGVIASSAEQGRQMYGHGFGMLFLAQVLGSTGDAGLEDELRAGLLRAIRVTAESQGAGGGWYYEPWVRGEDEGSVTATQLQALRACRDAGLPVPAGVVRRAVGYLERSRTPGGGIAYLAGLDDPRPAITAAALVALYQAGRYDSPLAAAALDHCRRELLGEGAIQRSGYPSYVHFYLGQAMFQAGGGDWRRYYAACCREFVRDQRPDGSWAGEFAGPVYGTAVALFTLQLPRRALPATDR